MFVVTDHRVINTRRTILTFQSQVNEIPLDGIHEISVALPSLMDFVGHFLGYGTLNIKTNGGPNSMTLEQIPHPQSVQQTIFNQRKLFQGGLSQQQRDAARNAMKADITKLVGSPGSNPASNPSGATYHTTSAPGLFSLKYTNEKGETVYRKHHAIWTRHVLLPGIIFLGGLIVLFVGVIGFILPLAIMLIGAILFYLADWDWRNDLYIIGEQTITIIHKRPLFLQDQKDQILLAEVDNVVAEVKGFFNTLLQIGEVKLLLTGSDERNAKRFTDVYQPQQIQQEISRRQGQIAQAKQEADARRQQQAIVDYLSVYHETVGTQPPVTNGSGQPLTPAQPANTYRAQTADEDSPQPPRVRDRSRPPGIPRVRRDVPPGSQ